jgi:hypothetical protein
VSGLILVIEQILVKGFLVFSSQKDFEKNSKIEKQNSLNLENTKIYIFFKNFI